MNPNRERDQYAPMQYVKPSAFAKFLSRFGFDGPEIQWLQQNNPKLIDTYVLDLTVAQPPTNPLVIQMPGRGFVLYGYWKSTEYNPTTNTGTEDANAQAFVHVRLNINEASNVLNLKHSRGFRGSFNKLYLSWPSQPNLSAKFYVLKYDATPWLGDSGPAPTAGAFATGVKAIAVAGVPAKLTATSQAITSVTVRALSTNTGLVYVGNSAATTVAASALQLASGDTQTIIIDDPSKVFVDTTVNGEGVSWIAS